MYLFIWLRSYDVLQLQRALALMHYSDKFEYTRLAVDRVKP